MYDKEVGWYYQILKRHAVLKQYNNQHIQFSYLKSSIFIEKVKAHANLYKLFSCSVECQMQYIRRGNACYGIQKCPMLRIDNFPIPWELLSKL